MADSPSTERASTRSRMLRSNDPPTYGYHNTFHTHDQPALTSPPPTYLCANSLETLKNLNAKAQAENEPCPLPPYTCTVEMEGVLGLKQELSSPFQVSNTREWNEVYVVLRGTQLSVHRLKSPHLLSKNRAPGPGRVVKNFSLQHAEIGIAADFRKTSLTPKSPFAHLIPASSRQKLFETDPHLFEPIREHVIRLRLETEQFLLCVASQEEMLDWVEALCAAIDISTPLEDRSEPRYRSLPRRSRRQRMIDGGRGSNPDNLSSSDAHRIIVAEQERIIRRLYPHLGADSNDTANAATPNTDHETDDLDPEDVRYPSVRRTTSHSESETRPSSSATTDSSADPKTSRSAHHHSSPQALRYRRRCAPVLLTNSPRVSDVVFSGGKRMRINVKEHILVNYTSHPPRYDVHSFPKQREPLPRLTLPTTAKALPAVIRPARPGSPLRGISDYSIMSIASTSEQTPLDGSLDFGSSSSEPPSPTIPAHPKADAARRLVHTAKGRTSEERARGDGLSAVALGVGLLI